MGRGRKRKRGETPSNRWQRSEVLTALSLVLSLVAYLRPPAPTVVVTTTTPPPSATAAVSHTVSPSSAHRDVSAPAMGGALSDGQGKPFILGISRLS